MAKNRDPVIVHTEDENIGRPPKFIIVVGASAGGLTALGELVTYFKTGMDAAVCIVLHLSRTGIGDFLMQRLQPLTPLACRMGKAGMAIERDCIYIAPPNGHLLVKEDKIIIGHGPEENRWRPSIDVLFRSAAVAYDGHTIGIILTGLLNDGTAGMMAIKKSGGACIVQDPNEAEYPDMPLSVLNSLEVDYCVPLSGMADAIGEVLQKKVSAPKQRVPEEIKTESVIAEKMATSLEMPAKLGEKSVYACPDCGGGLWLIKDGNLDRYRCHIGHSYTEKDLVLKQGEQIESTLWVALRMMEERTALLKKMENERRQRGFMRTAAYQQQRVDELQMHIDELKKLIFQIQHNTNNDVRLNLP